MAVEVLGGGRGSAEEQASEEPAGAPSSTASTDLHPSVASDSLLCRFAPEARMKRLLAYSTVRSSPGKSPRRRPASIFSQSQAKLGLGVGVGFRKSLSSFE